MRRTLSLTLLLAAAACSVSNDQESQMGQDEAAQVNAQLPILGDAAITDYVSSLGKTIAAKTARSDLDWHFAVINTDVVNAFALPGGYVYINRGVLAHAKTESELAAVMGHEIEHVVRRHSVTQMEKAQGANLGVALACHFTNICNHASARVAIQVGGAAMFAHNSRTDEAQADSGGFQNEIRAGLDPHGMLNFFEQLMADEKSQPGLLKWFSDHPGTGDRVTDVKRWLAATPPAVFGSLRADSPAFQAMKQRLATMPPAPKDTLSPPDTGASR